ncbi:hypothetical protein QBC39DRAFT_326837 [Podospora conica]|nr:hypothetical protein QBC39DRAFT_326837 [Schizothecium conicum]
MLERHIPASGVYTKPIKQSPLMVGCSTNAVKDRWKSHLPGPGLNTTATWGFVLCLTRHMGLDPDVRVIPALTTVKKQELAAAERLVTALAQSLVSLHGFNIVDGGGKSEVSKANARLELHGQKSWMHEHASSAFDEAQRRMGLVEKCPAIILTAQTLISSAPNWLPTLKRKEAEATC